MEVIIWIIADFTVGDVSIHVKSRKNRFFFVNKHTFYNMEVVFLFVNLSLKCI